MNSDFFSNDQIIQQLNIEATPLASYTPKVQILAGQTNTFPVRDGKAQFLKSFADADSIDFKNLTYNSTERNHFNVAQKSFFFNPALKGVYFNLAQGQDISPVNEAISKAITKASVYFDQANLNGADGNTGILTDGNNTTNASVVISNIDELISVLESMKLQLSEGNQATDNFKTLLPLSLKPLIEKSLSFTVQGTDRVFRSIGTEGTDFEYVPSFVDSTNRIIMSYAPQVVWLYTYVPQLLGSYVQNQGSVTNSFTTYEFGTGTTSIISLNENKAIVVQPYTTSA